MLASLVRTTLAAIGLMLVALWERLRGVPSERSSLPERLLATLERLGPTFVKAGQALSLRRDLLPDRYVAALSRLQAGARPFPSRLARQEIERSLGRPIADLFAHFEDAPLAAASIAQVHAARLADGAAVIVKVRRPGVEARIDRDMRAAVWLLRCASALSSRLARLEPAQVAREIWQHLRRETDFRQEARAIERFAGAFANWPKVHVPGVIDDLVTEAVLVQERAAGRLLGDPAIATDGPRYAATLVEVYLHQIFVLGFFHGDPHPGNLFFLADGVVCFHDFGLTGQLDHRTRRQLALFVQAFIHQDPEWMLDASINLGLLRIKSDGQALVRGIEELLTEYSALPMRDWSIAELFLRVSRLGRGDSLLLPYHLVVLVRAVFLVEHALHTLDPEMNVLDTLLNKGNAVLDSLFSGTPKAGLARLGLEAGLAAHDFPGVVASWMDELRHKRFRPGLRILLPQMEQVEAGVERTGNRLALALVTLGLYIASSLLMQHSIGPRLAGMPVLALAGYALALWYTLRLGRGIARSGRL